MMQCATVVLDTNVVIDCLVDRRAEHDVAVSLLRTLVAHDVEFCVAATSLKDVYYVLRRQYDEASARDAVRRFMGVATVLSVDQACCRRALANSEPDFEDGIIRAVAEQAQASYLISRDRRAFAGSRVARITPAQAVREFSAHDGLHYDGLQ